MKTVLVTGSTGCIGSNLCLKLLEMGIEVRALHRKHSNSITLGNADVDHRIGDILQPSTIHSAMKGCDTVFHTAAIVSFWRRRREEQLECNVKGTRNVVNTCLELGIQKLVHTSSIAALGFTTDTSLIDESTPFNWDEHITYKYSKHLAELEALRGADAGLNATIVNPTVVIGPRDVNLHGGQLVRDLARGRVPAYVAGGMNIVGVHDVVKGHIAAASKGKQGGRYILGGVNLSHKDVFTLVAKVLNVKPPRFQAPVLGVKLLANVCDLIAAVTSTEPWISSELISGIGMNNWSSIEKAKRELGYSPGSVEEAIRDAYDWYENHGMS